MSLTGGSMGYPGGISMMNDRMHPGKSFRSGGIYAQYFRMGMRALHEFHYQKLPEIHIIHKKGFSGGK